VFKSYVTLLKRKFFNSKLIAFFLPIFSKLKNIIYWLLTSFLNV
jgi:hypothetical protein